jgi:hypothetical protein
MALPPGITRGVVDDLLDVFRRDLFKYVSHVAFLLIERNEFASASNRS